MCAIRLKNQVIRVRWYRIQLRDESPGINQHFSIKSQLGLSRAGLDIFWCRRRDSNSHSFRHYPLKIACLPISPRRHKAHILTCFARFVQCTNAIGQSETGYRPSYFGIWPDCPTGAAGTAVGEDAPATLGAGTAVVAVPDFGAVAGAVSVSVTL